MPFACKKLSTGDSANSKLKATQHFAGLQFSGVPYYSSLSIPHFTGRGCHADISQSLLIFL